MDILIFGGQSNMQGQCEKLTNNIPVSGAYEYKWLADTVVPLKNPVGEDITYEKTAGYVYTAGVNQNEWLKTHVTGSSCYGHTNLVPEFCKAYIAKTHREVLAVHGAKGSTTIAQWLPDSEGYEILVEKVNAAKKHTEVGNVFFVWLQGESDAIEGNSKDYYKGALTRLCEALKRDVGIHKFGIIRVGRFTNDTRDLEIISAQDEVCAENDDFLMLTDIATQLNEQTAYMNPSVQGHYSAKGLEKLGKEAGTTLGRFVEK